MSTTEQRAERPKEQEEEVIIGNGVGEGLLIPLYPSEKTFDLPVFEKTYVYSGKRCTDGTRIFVEKPDQQTGRGA